MLPAFRLCNLAIILLAALLAACAPAAYTPERLSQLGALEINGVVVKQSRGSFALRDDDGNERTFRTGEMTQYLPADYRSQEADRVRVAYQEVLGSSGRFRYVVLQLEALAVAEQNRQLPNPIVGTIVATRAGSISYARLIAVRYAETAEPLPIYLPLDGLVVLVGERPELISDWDQQVGRQVSITAERIPILRGNGLIYVAKKVVLSAAPPPPEPLR